MAPSPKASVGTWHFYALPGAGGFYPVTAGWVMTLDEGSISFDFYGTHHVERSYTVVERSDRRYELEIKDARAATMAIAIELAPCGMLVEAEALCDAFCENFASELGTPTEAELRAIVASSLGDEVDEATLDRILQDIGTAEQPPQPPVFPERAYFRAVASD